MNKKTTTPLTKPTFKPEIKDQLFEILKFYFSTEHAIILKQLLNGETSSEKALFKWHGKTLLDCFKQLMIGQFISIPVQADFEKWISVNFMYLDKTKPKHFIPKRASKIISGSERAAIGNRLIEVESENGIFKIVQVEIKNRKQI